MIGLEADTIRRAAGAIPAAFRHSPQFVSEPLSELAEHPVVVKVESVNPIGCFKGRGSWLAVRGLLEEAAIGPDRGLIVASAGNFGQGVAYAARAHGIPLRVHAAMSANSRKIAAMRRLGALVLQAGHDFDAAREAAAADAHERGWRLLIDGQDPRIALGAASIAVELTDAMAAAELPELEVLYVPVGNGALIGGLAAWLAAARPQLRVIGVQAEAAPAMTLSWRANRPVETATADTIADGIATRVPVPEALALMGERVTAMVLVSESEIAEAQHVLQDALGLSVEPSAAVGWAALRRGKHTNPAGLILTGGNLAS